MESKKMIYSKYLSLMTSTKKKKIFLMLLNSKNIGSSQSIPRFKLLHSTRLILNLLSFIIIQQSKYYLYLNHLKLITDNLIDN